MNSSIFGEVGPNRPVYAEALGITQADPQLIPHQRLATALELAVDYNANEEPHVGEYLRKQFADFEAAVEAVPGYQGVFGTGHPFYAWKADGGVHAIQEIEEHTKSFRPLVANDRARNLGMWPCASCQRDNDLPNLKSVCKPCEIVTYKPRDLFKVLPDTDFWVIVDELSTDVERDVEARVLAEGFYSSDRDIKTSLETTVDALEALRQGEIPEQRVPLDLHVVTTDELLACIAAVPEEIGRDDEPGFIPISPRSLHIGWERTDYPYNFLKDYLFSLTPSGWRHEQLIEELNSTRSQAKVLLKGSVINRVAALASKEARQLRLLA
jgi:hypothetical protein